MGYRSKKIAYVPYEISDNRSHTVMRDCIRELGCEVTDGEAAETPDAIILSWYESVEGKTPLRALYHFVQKECRIRKLHKNGCRIISVFHNKYPHGSRGYNKFLAIRFTKDLYGMSSRVIVMTEDAKQYLRMYLSPEEIERKAFLIPHVGYGQLYPGSETAEKAAVTEKAETAGSSAAARNPVNETDEFTLLFFGLIKPYKGIENILEAAKHCLDLPIRFLICGKSYDRAYGEKLGQQAQALSNVEWKPEFIPEDEINEKIQSADAVLLPYDVDSSLNSGAIMHAFSVGRTVVSPMISTLTDFDPKLYYSYPSVKGRSADCLLEAVLKAYTDFMKDPEAFRQKGEILREQVEKERTVEMVKSRCRELLEGLNW